MSKDKTNTTRLIWFRRDLRLRDNPALHEAAKQGKLLAVFIDDSDAMGELAYGAASRWWLHHSLEKLRTSLDNKLHILKGDATKLIPELVKQYQCNEVFWNRCYEPWQIQRDSQIKSQLQASGISVKSFNATLLWEPWTVLKKDDSPYKVFTPYYRKGCLSLGMPDTPLDKVKIPALVYDKTLDNGLNSLSLLDKHPWHEKLHKHWRPGEEAATKALSHFLNKHLHQYAEQRDLPAHKSTSLLSPRLHFGELSPRQVWHAALHVFEGDTGKQALDTFLKELGWREFSYYLLYHFPQLPKKNLNARFDQFPWRYNNTMLSAWQQGQTGIPMVDAGMRELWQTGFMHNRVRMISASFLVKNLMMNWQHGEAWFRHCLVDADLAANSASWQWVAGSGADAAPYFRIFNPVLQGQRFDPKGDYIRRYCPELSKLPDKFIHAPWQAPQNVLQAAKLILERDYPHPIVDLKDSREAALAAYRQLA